MRIGFVWRPEYFSPRTKTSPNFLSMRFSRRLCLCLLLSKLLCCRPSLSILRYVVVDSFLAAFFFWKQVRRSRVNMSTSTRKSSEHVSTKKYKETRSHCRQQTGEPYSTKPASTLRGRCHHADAWKLTPKTGCTVL